MNVDAKCVAVGVALLASAIAFEPIYAAKTYTAQCGGGTLHGFKNYVYWVSDARGPRERVWTDPAWQGNRAWGSRSVEHFAQQFVKCSAGRSLASPRTILGDAIPFIRHVVPTGSDELNPRHDRSKSFGGEVLALVRAGD